MSKDVLSAQEWLTVPDLVNIMGISQSRVRSLLDDQHLVAARIDGVLKVPAIFLRDSQPMPELQGTIILLKDFGFSNDEAVEWLLSPEESLGVSPVDALRAGRKAEVRRVAQALL